MNDAWITKRSKKIAAWCVEAFFYPFWGEFLNVLIMEIVKGVKK